MNAGSDTASFCLTILHRANFQAAHLQGFPRMSIIDMPGLTARMTSTNTLTRLCNGKALNNS